MAGVPRYNIIPCCPESGTQITNFHIPDGPVPNGVYVYNGTNTVINGVSFENGQCYTIQGAGTNFVSYPEAPSYNDFTLVSNCSDEQCIACEPLFDREIIRFTSCCDDTEFLEFIYDGTTDYGTLVKPTTLFPGFSDSCYIVNTYLGSNWVGLGPAPSLAYFTVITTDPEAKCTDPEYQEICDCQPKCYTLVNCDGISFPSTNPFLETQATVGDYVVISIDGELSTWLLLENTGPCNNPFNDFGISDTPPTPCPCLCYEVVGTLKSLLYVNCDNEVVKDSTIKKFCSRIYPIFSGTPGQFQIIQGEECIDGLCPTVCYKLTNCDTEEVIYSTLQTLSQYVNTNSVVSLLGYEGCWNVDESTSTDCDCITVTIEDRSGVTEYTATTVGTYNGWGTWKFTIGTDEFFIWNNDINPNSEWLISINDCCGNPGQTYAESKVNSDCPESISDGSPTGWVIQEGVPWINVQTEKCPGPCECPVDITILQEFTSCETCEPYVAYKLQNCEKIYEVQYTTQDLSAYVNQVVETDCGCFTVQQINYVPPSETLVIIDNTFKTCNNCLSTFYLLTDCAGEVGDIVTTTDLSDYVGGVIKIENCDTCWEVTTTRTFTELSNVVVVNSYEGCPECGIDLPCVCSKITNLTLTEQTVEYIDCEDETQEITLEVGETSEKICLKKWIFPNLPDGQFLYPEYFGNCQNGVCPQPVFKNNRTVRPGYNTPVCTPNKYDEITCRFADIMYKVVLEKRYGITNCCPDEDDKWLVQKELIDLQALKDPNYNCPSCPCPCNSGKTCSTCNCKK